MTAVYNTESHYAITVRYLDENERRRILNIAQEYNLEYALAGGKIYLFIETGESLIHIATALSLMDIELAVYINACFYIVRAGISIVRNTTMSYTLVINASTQSQVDNVKKVLDSCEVVYTYNNGVFCIEELDIITLAQVTEALRAISYF